MKNNSNILVASPTYKGMKYCHNRFFNRLKNLTYSNYDILIIDNSEDNGYFNELKNEKGIIALKYNSSEKNKMTRLIESRNKIIKYALENEYEYLLMMDSDVIPPENIIEELLSCNKDIVSGLYYNYFMSSGKLKILPVAWKTITEKEFEEIKKKVNLPPSVKSCLDLRRHLTPKEANSNELLEVFYPSAGCMLISRKVFEKVRYGLLDMAGINAHTSDDIYFITKAREFGFKVYCYTKIKCNHLLSEKFKTNEKGEHIHPAYEK